MISDRLKAIIRRELDLDDEDTGALADATKAADVPGWDSLNHIRVISAVEKEYKVRFKGVEVMRLQNLGDLQRLIESKAAK